MAAYYNEIDPYCCDWLCNLMHEGLIADGVVDGRDIRQVSPNDLRGFDQCHFFAGLGGWSYALRLAGWPDNEPVWTGSCPCQPFSVAGKQKGFADERHLWPELYRLVAKRRPTVIFGEQVTGVDEWVRLMRSNMEEVGYAVGAIPIQAASARETQFRDRYFFVADTYQQCASERVQRSGDWLGNGGEAMADSMCTRSLSATQAGIHRREKSPRPRHVEFERPGFPALADAAQQQQHRTGHAGAEWRDEYTNGGVYISDTHGESPRRTSIARRKYSHWLTEPDVGRLAHGVPARVAKLRALGNAIVPQVAAEFIKAYLECRPPR